MNTVLVHTVIERSVEGKTSIGRQRLENMKQIDLELGHRKCRSEEVNREQTSCGLHQTSLWTDDKR